MHEAHFQRPLKILVAGVGNFYWYEDVCVESLRALGHEVSQFRWGPLSDNVLYRLENKFRIRFLATKRINIELVEAVKNCNPDITIIWRGVNIWPETIKMISNRLNSFVISYNNDDPFGPGYDATSSRSFIRRSVWNNFRAAIPFYDANFVFRPQNIPEYRALGARNVSLLMPYYIPWVHQIPISDQPKVFDAVFIGHYEHDNRVSDISRLVEAGLKVKVFGGGWGSTKLPKSIRTKLGSIQPIFGKDYVLAIRSSLAALSFHSKLNRDTYTRRSFEIPAASGLLVSERTVDLNSLYGDGIGYLGFGGAKELVEIVARLKVDHSYGQRISNEGHRICVKGGHDVVGRMSELISAIASFDSAAFARRLAKKI